ncbi:MAG TPA: outer membrane beta-barrel protein [Acidobacteriaceae bacterium]
MLFRKSVWLGLLAVPALLVSSAHAQSALKNDDIAVDGFAEFTQTVSGNGITDTPTKAGGGAASFRHSFHWWLGYDAGYEYTRYHESYTGVPGHPEQVYGVQHNQHEFSGSYYVHGPTVFIQPFALVGVSAVIFSPSLNGGQNVPWQSRPGINFGVGANMPLLTSHIGLRLEYRGVYYKAPNFGDSFLDTNTFRLTSEPMAGVYVKF